MYAQRDLSNGLAPGTHCCFKWLYNVLTCMFSMIMPVELDQQVLLSDVFFCVTKFMWCFWLRDVQMYSVYSSLTVDATRSRAATRWLANTMLTSIAVITVNTSSTMLLLFTNFDNTFLQWKLKQSWFSFFIWASDDTDDSVSGGCCCFHCLFPNCADEEGACLATVLSPPSISPHAVFQYTSG